MFEHTGILDMTRLGISRVKLVGIPGHFTALQQFSHAAVPMSTIEDDDYITNIC